MNHYENPLTPNQVQLLRKVVSKFKSKVRTPIEEEVEDKSPLLTVTGSGATSPRHTLAIPTSISPVTSATAVKPKPGAWGRFLRKTSEQMLGVQTGQSKVKVIEKNMNSSNKYTRKDIPQTKLNFRSYQKYKRYHPKLKKLICPVRG